MVRYQYVGNMYPLHGARGISRCAARVTTVPPAPRLQLNALYRVESRSRAPPARCRLTAGNSSLRVKLNASCAVRCDVTTTDRTCVCVACLIAHALVCRRLALRRYAAVAKTRCRAWMQGLECVGWARLLSGPNTDRKRTNYTIPTWWYSCRHYVSRRTVFKPTGADAELETEMRAIVYYS